MMADRALRVVECRFLRRMSFLSVVCTAPAAAAAAAGDDACRPSKHCQIWDAEELYLDFRRLAFSVAVKQMSRIKFNK